MRILLLVISVLVSFFKAINKHIKMQTDYPIVVRIILSATVVSMVVIFVSVFVAGGYTMYRELRADSGRGAIALSDDYFGDVANTIYYPDQNWSAADSLWYYNTTQGSNLMPYDIFMYLEIAEYGSKELFRGHNNIKKYRYLPQYPTAENPDGLPVGWVKNEYDAGPYYDTYEVEEYLGFTCSACHTTQINYKGVGIRIDGAPTLADMESMLNDLKASLRASLYNNGKFERLAKNVLSSESPAKDKLVKFRKLLQKVYDDLDEYSQVNAPIHNKGKPDEQLVHYGYARLDAFGRIYNRILTHIETDNYQTNPANAPVSYPFLWDTPQSDFVQWNGVGNNSSGGGLGPLGRNTGEVLGVFATFAVDEQRTKNADTGELEDIKVKYTASADSTNQIRLESQLKSLWSPLWQELIDHGIFEKDSIDLSLADQGRELYKDYKCIDCHQLIDRTDNYRRITSQFSRVDLIGTDKFMAENALTYCGKNGNIRSLDNAMCGKEPRNVDKINALSAVSAVTGGVILDRILDDILIPLYAIVDNPFSFFSKQKSIRYVDFKISEGYLNAYKGRPLNGIWATAPYLHNGSVPNLYELFLPSCSDDEIREGKQCRSNKFTTGSREFDTVKVGFVQKSVTDYPGLFVFDTSLLSNSNKGHEYVVGVTPFPVVDERGEISYVKLPKINDYQRRALVEYLKTL